MPDAAQLLKQDHRKVEALFDKYESGDSSVVGTVCTELKVHMAIEEEVLYPALPEMPEGNDLRQEAEKEHREVKDAIAEIERSGFGAGQEAPFMRTIIDGVNHHVEEEEKELFPKMTEHFGKDRMTALGDQLQAAKREQLVATGALVDLTKQELYQMAQAEDIPGRSDMTKQQLINALQK